jgi:hypothetical protein
VAVVILSPATLGTATFIAGAVDDVGEVEEGEPHRASPRTRAASNIAIANKLRTRRCGFTVPVWHRSREPLKTGSRRGPSRPTPSMLAARKHARGAVRRCGQDGEDRRSGASFCSRSETRNRQFCAHPNCPAGTPEKMPSDLCPLLPPKRRVHYAKLGRMSSGAAVGIGTGVCVTIVYLGVLWWRIRRAKKTYSKWIVKQLKRTGAPVALRIKARRGTWNPARPEVAGRLFANGQAVYAMDEYETIHLQFQPLAGVEQHYEGPIPKGYATDSPTLRRRRKLVRSVYLGYVALLLAGFILGYLLAGGSEGKRLITGAVGVLVAMLIISVAATFLRVGISVRTAMRERTK